MPHFAEILLPGWERPRRTSALDLKANRLYVVNTGSDNLAVVDAGKDEVVSEIAIRSHGEGFGCGPTSCAVDGDRLSRDPCFYERGRDIR